MGVLVAPFFMATINIPAGWVKDQQLNALSPAPLAEWDQPGQHMNVIRAAKPAAAKAPARKPAADKPEPQEPSSLDVRKMTRAQIVQLIKDKNLGPGPDGTGGINPDDFPTLELLRQAIVEAAMAAVKAELNQQQEGKCKHLRPSTSS